MSDFKTKPSGVVTLAVVGDYEIDSVIESVYGYDPLRDAWSVAIKQHNPPQGQWSPTVTVLIREEAGRYLLLDNSVSTLSVLRSPNPQEKP